MPPPRKRAAAATTDASPTASTQPSRADILAAGIGYLGPKLQKKPKKAIIGRQSPSGPNRKTQPPVRDLSRFKLMCYDAKTGQLHYRLPELHGYEADRKEPQADLELMLLLTRKHLVPAILKAQGAYTHEVLPLIEQLARSICAFLAGDDKHASPKATDALRFQALAILADVFVDALSKIPAENASLREHYSSRLRMPVMMASESKSKPAAQERMESIGLGSALGAGTRKKGRGNQVNTNEARGRLGLSLMDYMHKVRAMRNAIRGARPDYAQVAWEHFQSVSGARNDQVSAICDLPDFSEATARSWAQVAAGNALWSIPGGSSHPDVQAVGRHHGRFSRNELERQLEIIFLSPSFSGWSSSRADFHWAFLDPSDPFGSRDYLKQFLDSTALPKD